MLPQLTLVEFARQSNFPRLPEPPYDVNIEWNGYSFIVGAEPRSCIVRFVGPKEKGGVVSAVDLKA